MFLQDRQTQALLSASRTSSEFGLAIGPPVGENSWQRLANSDNSGWWQTHFTHFSKIRRWHLWNVGNWNSKVVIKTLRCVLWLRMHSHRSQLLAKEMKSMPEFQSLKLVLATATTVIISDTSIPNSSEQTSSGFCSLEFFPPPPSNAAFRSLQLVLTAATTVIISTTSIPNSSEQTSSGFCSLEFFSPSSFQRCIPKLATGFDSCNCCNHIHYINSQLF